MLDLIIYAENHDIPAYVLSLDFEKCFDKIDFSAIFGAMQFFEYPDYLIKWTKILYTDFTAQIQNNGYFSNIISVKRSVHQGGPCSSYYFLICAELLAIALRQNTKISGIPVDDILHLISQYADDADIYGVMNKSSLLETFQVLDHFQQHTGFTVSYDKTQILRIGSLKDSEARIYTSKEVKWTNGPICVLGVNICANNNMLLTLNYEQYVEKTKAILNNWCNKNLSLIAKINVVNVLIGSLFVYKMSVLPNIPESIVKKIEKIITEFIWSKKKAKIPLRTLQANKASGGLGLINLHIRDQAIKISWIKTMLQDDKYAKLAYLMLSPEMGNLIWKCNLNVPDAKRVTTHTFWSDVLSAWAKINYVQRVEYDDIIWLNSNIRIENKPIFWRKQFGRGLIYVSQLFSGQEPITVEKAN